MKKNVLIKKICCFLTVCLMGLSFAACSGNSSGGADPAGQTKGNDSGETLFVYSGAGLKKPMDEIAEIYKENKNIMVEYSYAGSAQLISQMELSKKGDVFIVGSEQVYKTAMEKDLAGEYQTVAHHTPVIAVPKGNAKGIQTLEDMAKDGVKVILGDEESNAIGKTAQKIIKKNKLEDINNNVVSKAATVNEIVTQLIAGQADAAIVTADCVFGNSDIETIAIDPQKNIDELIPIGIVKFSEKTEAAQEFVDFIVSDEGKAVFEKYGFEPVK